MTIDKMAAQFKTVAELQQYCSSQFQVINELNRKIVQLEEKNKHLEQLLQNSTPIMDDGSGKLEVYAQLSDEMAVCLMQIKILKDKGMKDELNYEEAKKLDIYTKLLQTLKANVKPEKNPAEDMSTEEILKLLEEDEKSSGNPK